MLMRIAALAACLLFLDFRAVLADESTAQQAEFFEAKIRPVLAEHCFRCHGPEKQKGGLRLDSRAALLKGGEEGPVVVPGEPDNSRLIQAVRYQGELRMPPKQKLPEDAIRALTIWVKMGAPWPESKSGAGSSQVEAWRRHWAFQPVKSPPLPHVKENAWPLTGIDRFILSGLESKGLTPSASADRRALIRRATFDLIGLPPTPEEVAAFENDAAPEAFARVVDRLLNSPHYGERWGRHWLDIARYADTKGYVFFQEANFPWAYTYRDYVIRSFNEDLPYDRFIVEQLAADQVVAANAKDCRPLAAMGFLTLGGRFMNNQHDILDDRIDVVTRGLLGLTVTCARCHDHKYDPIPSKDYYSLYGVFASSVEPEVPPLFLPPPKTPAYEKYDRELKAREKKLTDFVQAKHKALVQSAHTRVTEYLLAAHALRNQPSTEDFMLIADTNDLNPGMIIRWRGYLDATRKKRDPVFALWHAFADLPEKDFGVKAAAVLATYAKNGSVNPLVARAFTGKVPMSMKEVAQTYGELLKKSDAQWQAKLEASRRNGAEPVFLSPHAMELLQVFYGPDAPPLLPVSAYGDLGLFPDRASQARLQELRKALETWRSSGPGAPPRAMVLEDLAVPVQPRIFVRGNPNNLGAAVPRRFLSFLSGPHSKSFQKGSGRLELAQAIMSRDNPLTARVLVNRVWAYHFGAGLVRTPSDFGLRSEPPSHPELLDYLATTFMNDGWSLKKLHRRIMLSRVYQQRSDDRPECQAVDPDNRLLWKMNRQRLDFECMRDALLAVSGRLERTVGGPSVAKLSAPRRTMYAHLDRLNVPGLYRTFDFPSPDATSPQRDLTTVPQQALYLMNNPFILECARGVLVRGEIGGAKDAQQKAERMYRLLYGRGATAIELDLSREFLAGGSESNWVRLVQALVIANEFNFID